MSTGARPAGSAVARPATTFALLISALAPLVVLLSPDVHDHVLAILVAFLMVATPVAVGIYAQRSSATRLFGLQLVLLGIGLFVTTFAFTDSNALYTVARITGWWMELAVVYVVCAYPTGHLRGRAEWLTVTGAAVLVVTMFMSTLPVLEFPLPAQWTTCVEDCPTNVLVVWDTPAFVEDVIQPLRALFAAMIFLVAALVVARRARRASPLARTSLTPVFVVAILRFVSESVFLLLRGIDVSTDVLVPMAATINLTIPLVALGFLVGLLRWRLRVARALEGLNSQLGTARDARSLQATLRYCLEDPLLRIYFPDPEHPDRWRDVDGGGLGPPPDPDSGRALSPVEGGGTTVAVIACDVAIRDQRSLTEAIRSAVVSFLERERLTSALRSTLDEVDASRTRIAAAADATRRRIERDLHDGTQQRLIALRIRLELIEGEMAQDPERAQAMLRDMGPEVEAVIAEVRDLSRGIYPPLLVEAGPVVALRGVVERLPVEGRVSGELGRREEEVEAAVYFCCVEAIQNAIKHGGDGLGEIRVRFSENAAAARFEVADDGGGFAVAATSGSGITNMHDRIAAVGGRLDVSSSDAGTVVSGDLPSTAID